MTCQMALLVKYYRDFVTWLSSEIDLLTQGSVHSERVLVFISTMLQ